MAQTGYTPILIYSSSTTTNVPLAANLTNSTLGSELAINITDGKLFYKDNANVIQVIGWKTVPATAGGTGQTTYTTGDLLYASSSTALSKLADVATGNALISGGVSTAPSWGKIGLTTHVSGTLPVANGGTNLTSFTANGVVYASSTSALATGSTFVFDGSNVGIGLSNPSGTLHVKAQAGMGAPLYLSTTDAGGNAQTIFVGNRQYQVGTGNASSGFASKLFFYDGTAGATRMMLHESGGFSIGNTTDPGAGNLRVTGSVLVNAVAGIGYATGAGGAVTQGAGSGKATTVTLDKPTGQITMNNANLNAGATVNFTCNCSQIAATDTVQINVAQSGAYTASNYRVFAYPTGGNFIIGVNNWSGGNLAEAIVLNYTILKGVAS